MSSSICFVNGLPIPVAADGKTGVDVASGSTISYGVCYDLDVLSSMLARLMGQ